MSNTAAFLLSSTGNLSYDSAKPSLCTDGKFIWYCPCPVPTPPVLPRKRRHEAKGFGCSPRGGFAQPRAETAIKVFAKACLKTKSVKTGADKQVPHAPNRDRAKEKEEIYRLKERLHALKDRVRRLEDLNQSLFSAGQQQKKKAQAERDRLIEEISELADELEASCLEKRGLEEALAEVTSSRTTAAWLIGSGVALGFLTALLRPGKTASFIGFGVAAAAFLAGFITLVLPSAEATPADASASP